MRGQLSPSVALSSYFLSRRETVPQSIADLVVYTVISLCSMIKASLKVCSQLLIFPIQDALPKSSKSRLCRRCAGDGQFAETLLLFFSSLLSYCTSIASLLKKHYLAFGSTQTLISYAALPSTSPILCTILPNCLGT